MRWSWQSCAHSMSERERCAWRGVGLALGLGVMAAASAEVPRHPRFGFPVYTNAPSGRQLTGQHVPALTPALAPEDARRKFVVPPGFEVRLFASEPEVVNPVAMSWDDRGRLWVVELYEYPMGARPGEKGRDRVKILEDVDGDGRADTVKVFMDGLSLATAVLPGNGGVYVGQAPHLYWVEDTDGDDVADRRTVVQTGFGLEDRHELLNGFTWGPDGGLYMTHGVFTVTKAVDPGQPAEPVVLTAGVARYRPAERRLEVFAEGTSNPWGVDFDARGQAFVSACVIDHLFHLAPGGVYVRQAGQPPYPYAYGLLPSIVDHRHHMAAYAGICLYQGDQFPAEYRGMALQGNIHDNAIHQDRIEARGSTYAAAFVRDFVRANDGWFMPVSTQVGPDGAVWIMDWYDRYPCYQNANADPAGVDRERGRIWRVVWTGDKPGMPVASRPPGLDLGKATTGDLVGLLKHPNVWHRRMAQRVLSGRADASGQRGALLQLVRDGSSEDARLSGLWSLFGTGQADDAVLDVAASSGTASVRAWAARLTGERGEATDATWARLTRLAGDDDVSVQASVATAVRLFTSGSLTVNTPPRHGLASVAGGLGRVVDALASKAAGTRDRDLPFLLWMAVEPLVMARPEAAMGWLLDRGGGSMPLSGELAYKAMRRWCDAGDASMLDQAMGLVGKLGADSPLLPRLLQGLVEGQRGRAMTPTAGGQAVVQGLLNHANREVATRAQQLGAAWGDAAALRAALDRARDPKAAEDERKAAIRSARATRSDEVRQALMGLARGEGPDGVRVEAVRALGEVGVESTGTLLLEGWSTMTPAVRRAVAELCTTRWTWRWPLFGAIEKGQVRRGDLPPTVIRALVTSKEQAERVKAEQLFGKVQATSAEKLKVIAEKRSVVVEGPVDLKAGREVARRSCLVCHKLHGEGSEVGPDLTGVGRSSLDALLHNVIHPNEIIGQGYENVMVETRDGRTVAGRMVENSAARVRLLQAGGVEESISRSEVKSLVTSENSVMPEGLEQMPDVDFRNLMWFILAPPEDGKPLDEGRRRELMGGAGDSAALERGGDGESVALWAPDWRVEAEEFGGSPARMVSHEGENNVLVTHPFKPGKPAALVRRCLVSGPGASLRWRVGARPSQSWELVVRVDGKPVHREVIEASRGPWRDGRVALGAFAGREVEVRLENGMADGAVAFGLWTAPVLESGVTALRGQP